MSKRRRITALEESKIIDWHKQGYTFTKIKDLLNADTNLMPVTPDAVRKRIQRLVEKNMLPSQKDVKDSTKAVSQQLVPLEGILEEDIFFSLKSLLAQAQRDGKNLPVKESEMLKVVANVTLEMAARMKDQPMVYVAYIKAWEIIKSKQIEIEDREKTLTQAEDNQFNVNIKVIKE